MQTDQTRTDIETAQQRVHTGRNEPCPCGSGKKYKKCCLAKDEALVRQAAEAARLAPVPPPAYPPTPAPSDEEFEAPSLFDTHTEPVEGLPPEVDQKLETLWKDFEAIEKPSTERMNALLDALLALPPEATAWYEVFHTFARFQHADLPGVFRRITRSVPHTKETAISYFYWAAVEEFHRHGFRELLPEVVTELCTLDLQSYGIEALEHIQDYLLANGLDAEVLRLGDHFLPIVRQDKELFPFVAAELAQLIFEIRAGRLLLGNPGAAPDVESVARQLVAGIEENVYPEMASHLAAVALGQAPPAAWTHADFEFPSGETDETDGPRPESLRFYGTLLRVAQEGYQLEQVPPGCAFPALFRLEDAMFKGGDARKKKKSPRSLLAALQAATIDERVARGSRGLLGLNQPQALLLLQAHEMLLHCALRHRLIPATDATKTEAELAQLRSLIMASPKGEGA